MTPANLDNNNARMREPFDASKPIEELFEQIEDATDYVDAAGAPYIIDRSYQGHMYRYIKQASIMKRVKTGKRNQTMTKLGKISSKTLLLPTRISLRNNQCNQILFIKQMW